MYSNDPYHSYNSNQSMSYYHSSYNSLPTPRYPSYNNPAPYTPPAMTIPLVVSFSGQRIRKIMENDLTITVGGFCRRLIESKSTWMLQVCRDAETVTDGTCPIKSAQTPITANAAPVSTEIVSSSVIVQYGDGYTTRVQLQQHSSKPKVIRPLSPSISVNLSLVEDGSSIEMFPSDILWKQVCNTIERRQERQRQEQLSTMPALELALSTHPNVGWYGDDCSNNAEVNDDEKTKKHNIEVEVTSQGKLLYFGPLGRRCKRQKDDVQMTKRTRIKVEKEGTTATKKEVKKNVLDKEQQQSTVLNARRSKMKDDVKGSCDSNATFKQASQEKIMNTKLDKSITMDNTNSRSKYKSTVHSEQHNMSEKIVTTAVVVVDMTEECDAQNDKSEQLDIHRANKIKVNNIKETLVRDSQKSSIVTLHHRSDTKGDENSNIDDSLVRKSGASHSIDITASMLSVTGEATVKMKKRHTKELNEAPDASGVLHLTKENKLGKGIDMSNAPKLKKATDEDERGTQGDNTRKPNSSETYKREEHEKVTKIKEEVGNNDTSTEHVKGREYDSNKQKEMFIMKALENAKKEVRRIEEMKEKTTDSSQPMQWITPGMTEDEKVEARKLCNLYHEMKQNIKVFESSPVLGENKRISRNLHINAKCDTRDKIESIKYNCPAIPSKGPYTQKSMESVTPQKSMESATPQKGMKEIQNQSTATKKAEVHISNLDSKPELTIESINDAKKEVERIETVKGRTMLGIQWITSGMTNDEMLEAKKLCQYYHILRQRIKEHESLVTLGAISGENKNFTLMTTEEPNIQSNNENVTLQKSAKEIENHGSPTRETEVKIDGLVSKSGLSNDKRKWSLEDAKMEVERIERMQKKICGRIQWVTSGMTEDEKVTVRKLRTMYYRLRRQTIGTKAKQPICQSEGSRALVDRKM